VQQRCEVVCQDSIPPDRFGLRRNVQFQYNYI
jgi:hypothetical protein